MIDLKYLQNNFDEASAKLQKKGVEFETLENLQVLFQTLKESNAKLEAMKAEQNSMSKLFGQYMKEGKDISELKKKVDANKEAMVPFQEKAREAEAALYTVALAMPNFPDDTVPPGEDEPEERVIEYENCILKIESVKERRIEKVKVYVAPCEKIDFEDLMQVEDSKRA